jgi:hypothetical protein
MENGRIKYVLLDLAKAGLVPDPRLDFESKQRWGITLPGKIHSPVQQR